MNAKEAKKLFVAECEHCGVPYWSTSIQTKYCSECRRVQKSIATRYAEKVKAGKLRVAVSNSCTNV